MTMITSLIFFSYFEPYNSRMVRHRKVRKFHVACIRDAVIGPLQAKLKV